MPGNPGKKGEVGGVSGGRRQGPHYACLEIEVRGRRARGRSPARLEIDGRKKRDLGWRRRGHDDALVEWRAMALRGGRERL